MLFLLHSIVRNTTTDIKSTTETELKVRNIMTDMNQDKAAAYEAANAARAAKSEEAYDAAKAAYEAYDAALEEAAWITQFIWDEA